MSYGHKTLDIALEEVKVPGGKGLEDEQKYMKYHSDKPENICMGSSGRYPGEASLVNHRCCGPQTREVVDSMQSSHQGALRGEEAFQGSNRAQGEEDNKPWQAQ